MFKDLKITVEKLEKILSISIVEYEASDIHIPPMNRIAIRSLGVIKKPFDEYSILSDEDTVDIFEITMSFLSKRAQDYIKEEIKEKSYAGYALTIKGLRFRVNASRVRGGYYIVFRNIKALPPKINELNFFPETENAIKALAERQSGLFLAVGPTGCGKSTTLASIIDYINDNFDKNIVSLEDPIEYEHRSKKCNILQKELGRDFPSFVHGLISALREDPDVILIGEIRDEATLSLALEASETGHIVLATLHADSAVESIQRMISLSNQAELTRDRLKSSFLGVIAQKLISFEDFNLKDKDNKPKRKRVLLWEMLTSNFSVGNMIKESSESTIGGMLDNTKNSNSYNKVLYRYIKENTIPLEVALRYSPDKDSLLSFINEEERRLSQEK